MKMRDILSKAGEGLKAITSIGTGVIIGNVTSLLMPTVALPIKACAYIGSYVLSMMLSEKTDEYIDRKAEEYENNFNELKATVEALGQGVELEEG